MIAVDDVIYLCKQLQSEAQSIIGYMEGIKAFKKTGSKQALSNIDRADEFAIDNVAHCQKLVIAIADCFVSDPSNIVEEEDKK